MTKKAAAALGVFARLGPRPSTAAEGHAADASNITPGSKHPRLSKQAQSSMSSAASKAQPAESQQDLAEVQDSRFLSSEVHPNNDAEAKSSLTSSFRHDQTKSASFGGSLNTWEAGMSGHDGFRIVQDRGSRNNDRVYEDRQQRGEREGGQAQRNGYRPGQGYYKGQAEGNRGGHKQDNGGMRQPQQLHDGYRGHEDQFLGDNDIKGGRKGGRGARKSLLHL